MSDTNVQIDQIQLAVDRTSRPVNLLLVTLLAFVLVGVATALTFVQRDQAEPLVIGLLGVLSAIGVAALFAAAIGLLRVGERTERDPLSRPFIDSMAEGIVITDPDNRIVYANRSYARLTGVREGGAVRGIERVFSTNAEAAESVFRLSRAAREGRRALEEVRITQPLTADQAGARWYRVRVRPLESPEANRGRRNKLVVWLVADITRERDEQENSFRELQRAINFLDHAPAGFFSADPKGRILYMNATLADWLGQDLAQFEAGQVMLSDLVRGDGVALVNAVKSDHPGQARTEIVDIDLVKRGGQSLPVRLLHRVPFAADGIRGDSRTLVLNRSPGEDISEELRAAEVRFARFFNNTPFAIAAVGIDGDIRKSNAPFVRMLSQSGLQEGQHLPDLVVERDREKIKQALADAAAGKSEITPLDASLVGEKEERSLKFYISGVSDGDARSTEEVIVYALETTEQRALEAQFVQSQKMQVIGQFAGGVAHDFNNFLTAIIGFSDLLLANHRPTDPAYQDIMNIKQSANRAAGLVRHLLAFSRQQTLRPQRLEINNVILDLSILLDRLLGEQVELKVSHGPDLWPVMADVNQLEQVITNLAVNARDAMPEGGTLTIRTRNSRPDDVRAYLAEGMIEGDYIMIVIDDTGTGMSSEVMERIFEPFFSTKEVGKGTGLGLSTVYGIVKQTGGHIYCRSEAGVGTTFTIFLPRLVAPVEEKAKPGKVEFTPPADLTGSASILLVEDEDAVRAVSARALASRGYTVHEASTGTEALEVLEETGGAIDLVVSDVVMPEMDGPTLLKHLRQKQPDMKVIFVSGYAEESFRKNLSDNEKFSFLPKPFSLGELAMAVKESLAETD